MKKQQAETKTYTPSGKRKFKARVIDAASSSASLFERSAGAPQAEGDPEVIESLRFRMSGKDYRPTENDAQQATPEPTEAAPTNKETPTNKPGDTFETSQENFSVDEK